MTERGSDAVEPQFSAEDSRHMAHALKLARAGIGLTDPNPSVGCVLVREGAIVGAGTTDRAGGPHAEIKALAAAGSAAQGATVYVTLEPCAHHGRTGPCAEALISARVARVVAAALDPNPLVAGAGGKALSAAGIRFQSGLLEASARAVNRGFFSRHERGRPWVRLKAAASLDGRTALPNGKSQWITGPEARADVHRQRALSSAILTGIGTVLADDPSLTARPTGALQFVPPVRVVLDSSLRTPAAAGILKAPGQTLIMHTGGPAEAAARLEACGATVEAVGNGARVELAGVMRRLAELDIGTVWVEAGASLAGSLLEGSFVDELIVYVAPDLLGVSDSGIANFGPLRELDQRLRFEIADVRRLGRDLRITLTPASVPHDA